MHSPAAQLAGLRRRFDPAAEKLRAAVLQRAAARSLDRIVAADLLAYHEELLFLCAYPPSRRVLAAAERELRRVARSASEAGRRAALADSGVANTPVTHAFTAEMLAWLCRRPSRSLDLVWDDGSAGAALDELLVALVSPLEADGLDETSCSTRRWLALAAGRGGRNAVQWLVDRLLSLPGPLAARDRLVDSIELPVCYTPQPRDSRTFARFPQRPIFVQGEPLLRDPDVPALLETPLPARRAGRRLHPAAGRSRVPNPLPLGEAHRIIDIARATLCVRRRETDPVTYANPHEVWMLRLERGLDVAVIGMSPERRLPFDSYFGFVAARNRVPIAYGGGWVFFERCEIGVNLFDTFRGGESAHIFSQILRVYRQLFRVGYFQVDPFQFGADNEEAIQSGAFWFYHRLGFRPRQPAFRRLAATESDRIQREPGYRSPPRTLRRLARSQLLLPVVASGVRPRGTTTPDPKRIGLALTRWIGRRFAGDRAAASQRCLEQVFRALAVRDFARWPALEQDALRRFVPLLSMIPGLSRWPIADRALLLKAVRAKWGGCERAYALAIQRNEPFRDALNAIAKYGS